MKIVADNNQLSAYFLVGARATPGTEVDMNNGRPGEQVGVVVIKQTVDLAAQVSGLQPVLDVDAPYLDGMGNPDSFPDFIRYEADIVTAKENMDIVVIRHLNDVNIGPPAALFGSLSIRGSGENTFCHITNQFRYGWLDRKISPRVDDAFDPAIFNDAVNPPEFDFDPATELLPKGYRNRFANGAGVANQLALLGNEQVHLQPDMGLDVDRISSITTGAVIRFTHAGTLHNYDLIIPVKPQLTISDDQGILNPQPPLTVRVDTVVFDFSLAEFYVIWRGAILWPEWQERLEKAELTIH